MKRLQELDAVLRNPHALDAHGQLRVPSQRFGGFARREKPSKSGRFSIEHVRGFVHEFHLCFIRHGHFPFGWCHLRFHDQRVPRIHFARKRNNRAKVDYSWSRYSAGFSGRPMRARIHSENGRPGFSRAARAFVSSFSGSLTWVPIHQKRLRPSGFFGRPRFRVVVVAFLSILGLCQSPL